MRVYKLTPIDLSDLSWEHSRHQGEAIIRAENEHEARLLASELWEDRTSGTFINPWSRPSFSSCEEIHPGSHDPEGPAAVLQPDPASLPLASEQQTHHSP